MMAKQWVDVFLEDDAVPAVQGVGGCTNQWSPMTSTSFGLELLQKTAMRHLEMIGEHSGSI